MSTNWPANLGAIVVFAGGLVAVALGQTAWGLEICSVAGGVLIGVQIPTGTAPAPATGS